MSPRPDLTFGAEALRLRSRVLSAIRAFFDARDYVEVETPIRVPTPALEDYIDAFPSGQAFLRTSPELHMKRVLVDGLPRIYQIGACFRAGERGDLHHPEYSMLEWYCADADYEQSLVDGAALLKAVAVAVLGRSRIETFRGPVDLGAPWIRRSVREAFLECAGWDPVANYDAERFDLDLIEKVEPALPRDVPVALVDYPVEAAALARRKPGHPELAERWEVYIAGVELANAYSELTDAAEQRARFEACAAGRAERGQEVYPMDEAFLTALERGMPPSTGVALGVDRLLMLLAGAASLDAVLPFRDA